MRQGVHRLVPPSESVDVRSAHPSEGLLQHDEQGVRLTPPLPAPGCRRDRVDDVTGDFGGGTTRSLTKSSEPVLQKRWKEGTEGKAMSWNID